MLELMGQWNRQVGMGLTLKVSDDGIFVFKENQAGSCHIREKGG